MTRQANTFKIGLFVLGAAVIAIAAVVVLSTGALFEKSVQMETYLDESVQGLDVGSPVKFRGVRIGEVREITFASSLLGPRHRDFVRFGRYVLIRMRVRADLFPGSVERDFEKALAPQVENGLRVRVASQGLTGTAYVELDYLDPKNNPPLTISWQPLNPYIPSAPSTMTRISQTIDRVFQQLEQSDVQKVAADLDQFLVAARTALEAAHIAQLSESLTKLANGLNATNERVRAILDDRALDAFAADVAGTVAATRRTAEHGEQRVGVMLDDLALASKSVRGTAEEIEAFARSSELANALSELGQSAPGMHRAIDELPKTLVQLSASLRFVDRVIAAKQGDVEALLDNLRLVSENLKAWTEEAKANPGRVLFGGPPARTEPAQR